MHDFEKSVLLEDVLTYSKVCTFYNAILTNKLQPFSNDTVQKEDMQSTKTRDK